MEYGHGPGLRSDREDLRPLQGTHLVVMLGVKRGYGIPGILFMTHASVRADHRDGEAFLLKWYDDARSIAKRDPAACGVWQVIILYSGYHAVQMHRMAHWMYRHHMKCIARAVSQLNRFFTGIEIHPGARIGRRLFIDHGMGLVVGETAEIGDDCTLYHGVTLGGTGKEKGKRHPTLGNSVLVGAGAKILGPFRVGDNTLIGANSVVLQEVPADATVVGVPGRVVRHQGKPVQHSVELDHSSAPDPIEQDLCRLMHRVIALEKMAGLEGKPFIRRDCCDQALQDAVSRTSAKKTRSAAEDRTRREG